MSPLCFYPENGTHETHNKMALILLARGLETSEETLFPFDPQLKNIKPSLL
jgi:hypothetical protein